MSFSLFLSTYTRKNRPNAWVFFDFALYTIWCTFWVLHSSMRFVRSMHLQTGGEWSAPLDDVFIHFDFAKSIAKGHPFEWSIGNGYSSGNTSISYPFLLALGYLTGFQDTKLVIFAIFIAQLCVFCILLSLRHIFLSLTDGRLARLSSYVIAPLFLSVGALCWSLWSGMEVAWFLFTWTMTLLAFMRIEVDAELDPHLPLQPSYKRPFFGIFSAQTRRFFRLGLCGSLMVMTRPEALFTLLAFASFASWRAYQKQKKKMEFLVRFAQSFGPGIFFLVLQASANRIWTGEWSAAGAIVKLAWHSPFMTLFEKEQDYWFNFKYSLFKPIEYHFTRAPYPYQLYARYIIPALALTALFFKKIRRLALLLWIQIFFWIILVAFNNQVRWQNERYLMPALAWLLVLASLSLSASIQISNPLRRLIYTSIGAALLLIFFIYQAPVMQGQAWFFGRACRNIRDQQIALGRWLRDEKWPKNAWGDQIKKTPPKVLVGDAGAITYTSGWPGLDLIGLGGYGSFPFARAVGHHLPASIELMERLPKAELPQVMAIFPSWWGNLPLFFTKETLRHFPIDGNVICGDIEHVVYWADWSLLGTGDNLAVFPEGTSHVVDALDSADIVNESIHHDKVPLPENLSTITPRPYPGFDPRLSPRAESWINMKILAHPADVRKNVLDSGRHLPPSTREYFKLRGFVPGDVQLIFRTAPLAKSKILIYVDNTLIGDMVFEPHLGWVERNIVIPKSQVHFEMSFTIESVGPFDYVNYHIFGVQ